MNGPCVCDDRRNAGSSRQGSAEPGEAWLTHFHPAGLARLLLHLAQGAANALGIEQGEMAQRTRATEQAAQQHGEGSSVVTSAFMPGGGDRLMTGTAPVRWRS